MPRYPSFDIETYVGRYCNVETKGQKKMITKDAIKQNQFYIGSPSVLEKGWGHPTIEEAIDHARERMHKDGSSEVFIVQIVKLVKVETAPVSVTDITDLIK